MPVKSKLGIIDTQDVILGNPMYDVASLIDDVRNNHLTKLCREDMLKCNGLWRKYD